MNAFHKLRPKAAFTLVETLIVIFILTIIASVLIPVVRKGIDAWILSMSITDLIAEGRLAMRRMTKELKMADNITEITSMPAIQSVKFTLPGYVGEIEYYWSNSNNVLYRRRLISGSSQTNVLARDISALTFTYLKRDSQTQTTTLGEVWEIRIDFTVTKEGRSMRFGSTISPRNLTHP